MFQYITNGQDHSIFLELLRIIPWIVVIIPYTNIHNMNSQLNTSIYESYITGICWSMLGYKFIGGTDG